MPRWKTSTAALQPTSPPPRWNATADSDNRSPRPAVQEDGKTVWRYMRALPTGELCLGCHGAQEQLSPAVKAKLVALYPDDRATGYRIGDIRGAMTLKKPAP